MDRTHSNWRYYFYNLTNEARAKRKSKRNRAWKAIHRAARRLGRAKVAEIKNMDDNIVEDISVYNQEKPSFLNNLQFNKD